MHHLMMNLPVVGALGVYALLAGPLVRLPIDLGAWLLEMLARWMYEALTQHRHWWRIPVGGRRATHCLPPPRPFANSTPIGFGQGSLSDVSCPSATGSPLSPRRLMRPSATCCPLAIPGPAPVSEKGDTAKRGTYII
jgi:hypothetical protein